MSAFLYLGFLIAALVAAAVYIDRRWARYVAGANTAAETPTKVLRPTVVTPEDASGLDTLLLELLMTSRASVPAQRRPGRES